MKITRLGAGSYDIETEHGTFWVYRTDPCDGSEWHIQWPGRRDADAWVLTLREAKAVVADEIARLNKAQEVAA